MPLTKEQLENYETSNQNEFILRLADGSADVAGKASSFYWLLHWPHAIGLVNNEQMLALEETKNGYIQQGARVAARGLVEAVPQAQGILEAINEFISQAVSYVKETLGIETDRDKVIKGFSNATANIEQTLDQLPAHINRESISNAVAQGLRDAGSSLGSIRAQISEETRNAVEEITGETQQSKADEVAVSAAASTYRRVYENLMDDFAGSVSSPTATQQDEARRSAHSAAAQVSGIYMTNEGDFEPAKDGSGNYSGMFGFVHAGIKQVEAGQAVNTQFTLAPTDEVARAAASAPPPPPTAEPAAHGEDVHPQNPVAPPATPTVPGAEHDRVVR